MADDLTTADIAAIDATKPEPLAVGRLRWVARSGEGDRERRIAATAKLQEIRQAKAAS